MNRTLQQELDPLSDRSGSRSEGTLPWLVLLFIGSGCAALIYEVVWFQLLQFVIGSSAVSLAVLLATFMGGMCLGSLALPRWIGRHRHPLRVYAWLELLIGICGLVVMFGMPYLDTLYARSAVQGGLGILLRGLVATVCLLPPTICMGATLPAVARWVEATPRGVSWLGFFYGGNIVGAVCGCLLAGFYLLRVYDMATATYVAVGLNVLVACIGFAIAACRSHRQESAHLETRTTEVFVNQDRRQNVTIYLAIALSGLGAIGAEVVWTRLLSLVIGGTVYTFSIILAVFLIGLGMGSSAGAWIGRNTNARVALSACQLLLLPAIGWAALQLTKSVPYWPIEPTLSHNPWNQFQLDLLRCLWVILPASLLWGASFPLALAAVVPTSGDPGDLVGRVYAANTLGAILGALSFSLGILGVLGTYRAQQTLVGIATMAAVVSFLPAAWRRFTNGFWSGSASSVAQQPADLQPAVPQAASVSSTTVLSGSRSRGFLAVAATLGVAIVAAVALGRMIPKTPGELIAHGRYLPRMAGASTIIYQGEGMNSSVAVGLASDAVRTFHVSGKVEASSMAHDMRLQRMLGHIPALVHPKPRSVLIVGCGAGVTAGTFVIHPDVERIVICELEPLIPKVVAQYFERENYGVVNDKRVEVVYDDARHFILTTREKFDVITSDPIHPWVKGAATLYTREYFELCRQRLNPGGVISQWVPLYESSMAAVKSELATFFEVFPHGTVWGNDQGGAGYDTVLLGQESPLVVDVDQLLERLNREDHAAVATSLNEVGLSTIGELLGTYAASGADLKSWLSDAQINRDRNLRLQYIAGMGSSNYLEAAIYYEMLRHRRFPEQALKGSEPLLEELRLRLSPGGPPADVP